MSRKKRRIICNVKAIEEFALEVTGFLYDLLKKEELLCFFILFQGMPKRHILDMSKKIMLELNDQIPLYMFNSSFLFCMSV